MRSFITLTACAVMAIMLLSSTSLAQDTGIRDSVRIEPSSAFWNILTEADSIFSIEVWGYTDQSIAGMTLGFKLLVGGGDGISHDDSLIVVDTFVYDPQYEWTYFSHNRSYLQPDIGTVHHGFNGLLVGGVANEGDMLQKLVPSRIGDIHIRILDLYELPESFSIVIDSVFYPPAGPFKFAPGRRTFMVGYTPEFSSATIQVENGLGIPIIPEIGLSSESFAFTAEVDGDDPLPQVLQISNIGTGVLEWQATDDADWLSLKPGSGIDDSPCTLFVNTDGLGIAQYNATITVSDPEAANNPRYVDVTLDVVDAPAIIALQPTSFQFEAVEEGENPASQVLTIFNGAKGELHWSASDDAVWLTLDPESGTGNGTCTLSLDIAGLVDGDYSATITVSDPDAPNSPQMASVALHIEDNAPVIVITPSTFYFEALVDGDNPDPQTISITNGGVGELNWSLSDDADWLTLDPVVGTGDGSSTLYVDISGMSSDIYTAVVTVTDPAASNNPQTAVVSLQLLHPPGSTGDNCTEPIAVTVPADLPYDDDNYTCGRSNYYDATCLGSYDGGEDIIYEVTVTQSYMLEFSLDPRGTSWCGMLLDDQCPPDPVNCLAKTTSSSGQILYISNQNLDPGVYYVMIDTWPSPNCIPDFHFNIDEGGVTDWGFDCNIPIDVIIPQDLPFVDPNQSTCGMYNDYSSTCLGYYDGGEDIIYRLNVTSNTAATIIMDPKGTTWTGIVLDDACPPDPADCIAYETASGGVSPLIIYDAFLEPGYYYIMVDTWPSPNCIPDFDLMIEYLMMPGEFEVSPSEFNFGTVDEGESGTGDLTLINAGDASVEYSVTINYGLETPPEIEGAHVTANAKYVPGSTVDMSFSLTNDSQDAEWLDEVTITFPEGVAVNSSTDFAVPGVSGHSLHYDGTTGEDVTVRWFDDNGGYGNIYSTEVAHATLNLSFADTLEGDILLGFTISGDEYGGDPHDVSGTMIIEKANPSDSWLTVSPASGEVPPNSDAVLTVGWNTLNLYNGVHEANIILSHESVGPPDIIPVTIEVINGPAKAEFLDPAYYMYYMFAYDPMFTSAYVGNFNPPYGAGDVTSVSINGITTDIVGVVPEHPGFDGEVVEVSIALAPFLQQFGAPFDTTSHAFSTEGSFSDASIFDGAGSVDLIGKSSADPRRWIVPEDAVVLHGDLDGSGWIDIDDVVDMIELIFSGGMIPGPMLIADCDCSDSVDIDDVVYLIAYIFSNGPEPCHT